MEVSCAVHRQCAAQTVCCKKLFCSMLWSAPVSLPMEFCSNLLVRDAIAGVAIENTIAASPLVENSKFAVAANLHSH